MGFWNTILNPKRIVKLAKKGVKAVKGVVKGTPEKIKNVSTLRPRQEGIYKELTRTAKGKDSTGVFAESADTYRDIPMSESAQFHQRAIAGEDPSSQYYKNLLSDNSQDVNAFSAPAIRQYNEEIVPGLSEQFAGMGAGGLSSSGFRNAQIQGATDLSERLGAIRANLRQSGAQNLYNIGSQSSQNLHGMNMQKAQGLQGIGEVALKPTSENVRNTPQPGFWENMAEGVGEALPGVATQYLKNKSGNSTGNNSSPYRSSWGTNNLQASPQITWNN